MPTQVNRLAGNFAQCAVGAGADQTVGSPVAQLVNWEVTIRTTFADGTGHGDLFYIPIILRQEWTARCEGFLTEGSRVTFASVWADAATGAGKKVGIYTFIGYNDYASLGTNDAKVLFRGNVYPESSTLRLPDGMSNQEILFQGAGTPIYIGIQASP